MIKIKCNIFDLLMNTYCVIWCLLETWLPYANKYKSFPGVPKLSTVYIMSGHVNHVGGIALSHPPLLLSHLPFTCRGQTGHITAAPPHYVAPTAVLMYLGQHAWRHRGDACLCLNVWVCVCMSVRVSVCVFFTASWISRAKFQIETQSAA